jgi:hypothetical protein
MKRVAASFEIRTKQDLVLDPAYKYEGRWSIPRAGCACDLDFDLCRRGEREGRRRCGMCWFRKIFRLSGLEANASDHLL